MYLFYSEIIMVCDILKYYVAELCLHIDKQIENKLNSYIWNKFIDVKDVQPDIRLNVQKYDSMDYQVEKYYISPKYTQIIRYNSDVVLVDENWSLFTILEPKDEMTVQVFLNHIFYSKAIFHHMIQCHSALVKWKRKGILFLGPSGIGKTTQAELWNKYRDALIINGDIVFVQETEDGFLGWGTPWHGSSPYCENTSVPVKALVMLKQAPENSIRELTGFEKVTAVSNSVFYPRWLENGMELCLETLDHLLSALPVYELSCRPDEEAVQLTEEAVFGRG